jgi:alanine dehydrogenase
MIEEGLSGKMSFEKAAFMPEEKMLETAVRNRRITIGIAANTTEDEKRVALSPESVNILVESDNEVLVQKGAGTGANFTDKDYSENGATITESPSRIFGADVVIKVDPFTPKECDLLKGSQVIMSYLNVLKLSNETLEKLMKKKVTAIAFEKVRDKRGSLPVVEAMSEINGGISIIIASEYLSNHRGGKGVMLGGVTGIAPTEVVIIGANTAGESAARVALGLGSKVMVFDNSLHSLRFFQRNLGQKIETSVFHPPVLKKALKSADVLIGAIELDDLKHTYFISEEMIRTMKKGSIAIDLSIDRGGCIETSECRALRDPVYEKHGVIHFSAWNLPSRVARTASMALSNIFTLLLQNIADAGDITSLLKYDQGLRKGAYLYNGMLTDDALGRRFGIKSNNLDLLISAF